jgi:hypothetical protein
MSISCELAADYTGAVHTQPTFNVVDVVKLHLVPCNVFCHVFRHASWSLRKPKTPQPCRRRKFEDDGNTTVAPSRLCLRIRHSRYGKCVLDLLHSRDPALELQTPAPRRARLPCIQYTAHASYSFALHLRNGGLSQRRTRKANRLANTCYSPTRITMRVFPLYTGPRVGRDKTINVLSHPVFLSCAWI